MSNRPDLVPTSIVDSRGRQTTVHRKPLDAASGALKSFPAPAAVDSPEKRHKELVEAVAALAHPSNRMFLKMRLTPIKDEDSLLEVKQILEAPYVGNAENLSSIVTFVERGEADKTLITMFASRVQEFNEDFDFDLMYQLWVDLKARYDGPPTNEQFFAHVHVAARYDATRGIKDHDDDIWKSNGPSSYRQNGKLMDFVTRHPDKADVIIKHRETYLPEQNGFEQLEADLDMLSELTKSVSEGWL